ncbi:MAG: type I DNA topoisomerase [Candidatus Pacebacteria bacterium CG10_big_fil_rev_8_21_14_0_10_36_11]|nr:type I DNA topoisomerase [Candidatus Pacearchaeota archaeon]PIR64350.1 MAG: type I DNA topoisomerase [Candidatus Pacebacteria bacterium CG10_big_fil_rev_8_21_14_0_10_36_11]PJC43096.1 MAG: type I DNA topoisomerase [Candidatus Pacebacteria bacterium CG_4_9_14_0_2_um_filter_36_8]
MASKKMKLVIVESPTKARKLRGYLGSDYIVEASVGHIRDLPTKSLGINIEKDFEPEYEVSPGKKKVLAQLKKAAKESDTVYLAMDPDREGEAIAWHVKHLLDDNKGSLKFVRSTFHQITKTAVMDAINHPSEIILDLVDAQQARRVVDRLVGYKVSPVLWKKVRRGLSAGRVQSVALRLIVEREREIEAFKAEEYWEVNVGLNTEDKKITIFEDGKPKEDLVETVFLSQVTKWGSKKFEPKQEADITPVVDFLKIASYQVTDVEQKQRTRQSLPPFTTSTLQQAAANKFGYSAKQTMALAQQLYEEGLITYHRTDSVNLATEAIAAARSVISSKYGDKYLPSQPRLFATKSKNAQEAHEAIRPTDADLSADLAIQKIKGLQPQQEKLYDLIWKRFIASQMESAIYQQTKATIEARKDSQIAELQANGSVKEFDGWMILFSGNGDTLLPLLTKGQEIYESDLFAAQKFTQPPARYNDASLIKELEKRGIGRPSTYASIISVIVDRSYVERKEKRFFAAQIGKVVSDFLVEHFPEIMSYDFTAEMEEDLDRIARGEKEWKKVVKNFFTPLSKKIGDVEKTADRAEIPVVKTGIACPTCGETEHGEIVIRDGRFGKFKSCSRFPECKFTENIVEKLEGQLCPLCQKGDIVIKPSRWGKPFFGCGSYPECNWASWTKPAPDLKISESEWKEQQAARAERKKARDEANEAKAKPKKATKSSKKKSTRTKKK